MKFKIKVGREDGSVEPWWEEYDKQITDPDAFGREVVAYYNATITDHRDRRRKYLGEFEVMQAVSVADRACEEADDEE